VKPQQDLTSSGVELTHNPAVFDQQTMLGAMQIILTPEGGQSTEERWQRETGWLVDLIIAEFNITPNTMVLDYGCGIGRIAKALISRTGCAVVGVDTSRYMRAHAAMYVDSERFACCHPDMLARFYGRNFKFDVGLAIWVLQHCFDPVEDIARLAKAVRETGRRETTFSRGIFVLNNLTRSVPTVEQGFVDDKFDLWAEMQDAFGAPGKTGRLPMQATSKLVSDHTQWAIYA
jgi:SAM-dependent methyltransferase